MKCVLFVLSAYVLLTGAAAAHDVELVTVNGEAITGGRIDAMIMDLHRGGGMDDAVNRDITRLLNKAVNDVLIVQQALAMGMDQDPTLLPELEEKRRGYAVQAFVDASFTPPPPPAEDEVRADFEEYYRRIQVRQISLGTEEEAAAYRRRILDGEDMAALAAESSLDVHRFREGLHNLKHWADVENAIRDQVRDRGTGHVTDPFPYRQAWSVLRVEDVRPVDEADYERFAPTIRGRLRAHARDRAWAAYVDSLETARPVEQNHAVLLEIHADGDEVFEKSFLIEDDRPVLICGGEATAAGAFRKAVSRTAMENGTTPFDELMGMALERETERLALRAGAAAGGFMTHPDVERRWLADRDEALIQGYLAETVVEHITFRRDEFEAFYQEHLEDFRGPDQVRLDVVVLPDEATARAMEEHLAQGADFDYVRERHVPGESGSSQPEWAPVDVFSKAIRDEVARLETGGASKAIPIPTGWMIFRVLDRREGRVPPLEDVDMEIRKVMFQRKFTERLDEHLALLKERSEIVRHEDRIESYFSDETD